MTNHQDKIIEYLEKPDNGDKIIKSENKALIVDDNVKLINNKYGEFLNIPTKNMYEAYNLIKGACKVLEERGQLVDLQGNKVKLDEK